VLLSLAGLRPRVDVHRCGPVSHSSSLYFSLDNLAEMLVDEEKAVGRSIQHR